MTGSQTPGPRRHAGADNEDLPRVTGAPEEGLGRSAGTARPHLSAVEIAGRLGLPSPTDEQRAVIEAPLAPQVVVAGAGSGKTETMAARVVYLVANGMVNAEDVLGLTFTRKAAAELAERIRRRLNELTAQLHRSEPRKRPVLTERPTVATYNSFAAELVRDHALRIGVDPDARLITDAASWQLVDDLVRTWPHDLGLDVSPGTVTGNVRSLANALGEHLLEVDDARTLLADLAADLIQKQPEGTRTQPYADVKKILASLTDRIRLLDIVAELRRVKRERGLIEFSDQVRYAAEIAERSPQVGAELREQYRLVLLDEYQDTSVAQVRMLSRLFGGGHPVTAVGDPHQAIYGWRGASAAALADFPEQFRGGDEASPTLYLRTAWRNDTTILAAANEVAAPLRQAPATGADLSGGAGMSGGAGPGTTDMDSVPGDGRAGDSRAGDGVPGDGASARSPGTGDGARLLAVPELLARPGAGSGRVRTAYLTTQAEEADLVARELEDWWRDKEDDGTAAVLCRRRSQFAPIVAALRERNVPVSVVGLEGLLAEPEIVDLRCTLQAAHDASRGDALMRLLTGRRIGIADLRALNDWARHLGEQAVGADGASSEPPSRAEATDGGPADAQLAAPPRRSERVESAGLVEAVEHPPSPGWRGRAGHAITAEAVGRVLQIRELLRQVRAIATHPLAEIVTTTIRLLRLDIEVIARGRQDAASARANLEHLIEIAAGYDADTDGATLGGFLGWLDAVERHERPETMTAEPEPGAVQVLTVHASKGLEWDVVVVPGLVGNQFPKPEASGWLTDRGTLPYPLRGDAEHLPALDVAGAATHKEVELARREFRTRHTEHSVAEERRLAYVALTRARSDLLLTGSWMRTGKTPLDPSPFLTAVRDAGIGTEITWEPEPEEPETHQISPSPVPWPADPAGARRDRLEAAAAAVRQSAPDPLGGADADLTASPQRAAPLVGPAISNGATTGPMPPDEDAASRIRRWRRDAALLLRERETSRSGVSVELGRRLSTSRMMALVDDPMAFAVERRRPLPSPPSRHAQVGVSFHAAVESYYGRASLLETADLSSAEDTDGDDRTGADLDRLRATFEASPWATRRPIALEVELVTTVAGIAVTCRIDAVFDDDHGCHVVDWKTGRQPQGAEARRRQSLQLAFYRLAWSRYSGRPLEEIGAVFYYVADDENVEAESLTEEEIVELVRVASGADAPS